MSTTEQLIAQRFDAYHEPRSDAFKTGFRATLEACVNHTRIFCPYLRGTAEADAFFAGAEEARAFLKTRTQGGEHASIPDAR